MTLQVFGDLIMMLMVVGSGILLVYVNANYIPNDDNDENNGA